MAGYHLMSRAWSIWTDSGPAFCRFDVTREDAIRNAAAVLRLPPEKVEAKYLFSRSVPLTEKR
jgi:hypothetical protein